MTELLTAGQMRAIEQAAIASGEVTGLELMERAGRGVVEAILDWRPDLAKTTHRAVVLCGPGNNGGDGFVVARLLKQRGWEVEVFLYGDEGKQPPDAAENARRWRELGDVEALPSDPEAERPDWPEVQGKTMRVDLVVDALFGIGLKRPLQGSAKALATEFRLGAPLAHKVAVDMPSGLCSDSGQVLGGQVLGGQVLGGQVLGGQVLGGQVDDAFHAEMTVTFHAMKPGHVLAQGPGYCGAVRIVDIGL